jgi:transaldolase
LTEKPSTLILVDGGDPNETLRAKSLLGFVDGQTTNPSLIATNPESVVLRRASALFRW